MSFLPICTKYLIPTLYLFSISSVNPLFRYLTISYSSCTFDEMERQVILTFEDLIYDDYGSVIGQDASIGYLYWGTFRLVIKHLSTNRTMEGDYALVF